MKQLRRLICLFSVLTLLFNITGCQKKENEVKCPFTTITWEDTLKDIQKLEGSESETSESPYKGTMYSYPKKYNDSEGTIGYMFDDKEKLVGISWTFISEDADTVKSIYEKTHGDLEKQLGESNYMTDADKDDLNTKLQENQEQLNTAGMSLPMSDVWYRKSGNVITYAVITNEIKAAQFTFLHPDVSQKEP